MIEKGHGGTHALSANPIAGSTASNMLEKESSNVAHKSAIEESELRRVVPVKLVTSSGSLLGNSLVNSDLQLLLPALSLARKRFTHALCHSLAALGHG